jgi:hypothetical protein
VKRSSAWKAAEGQAAEALKGKRIPRGADFSKSAPDVDVPDFPFLKIDAKRYKAFAHHTLMDEVIRKYCLKEGDVPVLITKTHGQRGAYATVPLEFLALLLEDVRKLLCQLDPSTESDSKG